MKILALVFVAVIATGLAIPQPGSKFDLAPQVVNEVPSSSVASLQEALSAASLEDAFAKNIVSDLITGVIQFISQILQELGLDPLNIRGIGLSYYLPVPSLFGFSVNIPSFSLGGISNIVINQLSYGLLTSRITFDISLPQIVVDFVENSELVVRCLSKDFKVEYSGSVAVREVGLRGNIRINLGIIGGSVSIRDMDLNFYIGDINTNIRNLNVLGEDLTVWAGRFIEHEVFPAIKSHEDDISDMIEIIAWEIIDWVL